MHSTNLHPLCSMTSEQNAQMQQNAFTLVMGFPDNTKIGKTLSIVVPTTLTMALRQNGVFLPLVMAKAHVMAHGILSRGLLPIQVYR